MTASPNLVSVVMAVTCIAKFVTAITGGG